MSRPVGGLSSPGVFCDVAGLALNDDDRRRLRHPACVGVILFARNYADKAQLQALTREIHALKSPPLLIAVDQEGGRVQRFREGFLRLPPAGALGRLYDRAADEAERAAEAAGWLMAAECLSVGVDFSFAPVLDIDHGASQVIGDRAFHHTAEGVIALAGAFMRGMHQAGMVAVGKHFPGHGHVQADSHLELPVDERSLETLRATDLRPFAALVGQGMEGIMPAHVRYPAVAPEPAGFSPFWLGEVLRRSLHFRGLIFSDDLSMQAAHSAGSPAERGSAAWAAGCDMLLVCNDPEAAEAVLDVLPALSAADWRRLARLRADASWPAQNPTDTAAWQARLAALPHVY